jgi:hypothetical protein
VKTPSYAAEENRVLSHGGWAVESGTPVAVCTGSAEYAHAMAEMIADALNRLEETDLKRQAFAAKCARYQVMNETRKITCAAPAVCHT